MCLINTLPVFARMANSDVSKYSITMDVNIESFESSHDYAKNMFEENSVVFNEVKDWVLSEECQPFYKNGPFPEEVRQSIYWAETRSQWEENANLYRSEPIFEKFDTLFTTYCVCDIIALNENYEINLYENPAAIVSFWILSEQYEYEDISAPPPIGYQEKMVIIYYTGTETCDVTSEKDYIEALGDGWYLTMCGYDKSNFEESITTTTSTLTTQSTTTSTTTTTSHTTTSTTTTECISGDCNNDDNFNISDCVLFQKWLLGVPGVSIKNWENVDFNKDKILDAFDMCLMRRELIAQNDINIYPVDNPEVIDEFIPCNKEIKDIQEPGKFYIIMKCQYSDPDRVWSINDFKGIDNIKTITQTYQDNPYRTVLEIKLKDQVAEKMLEMIHSIEALELVEIKEFQFINHTTGVPDLSMR